MQSLVCGTGGRVAAASSTMLAPLVAASARPSFIAPSLSLSSAVPSFNPVRTYVTDRAVRRVGKITRKRRSLLRQHSHRYQKSRHGSATLTQQHQPAQRAGFMQAAANLHQFVAFMARQHKVRMEEEENKKKLAGSTADSDSMPKSQAVVEPVAAAKWQLTMEQLRTLCNIKANHNFRACEELLCALSDPTMPIGSRGLSPTDFSFVLSYVLSSMQHSLDRHWSKLSESGFPHMEHEQQDEVAGAMAVMYLVHTIKGDAEAAQRVIDTTKQFDVFPPKRTLLYEKTKHDVYPPVHVQHIKPEEHKLTTQ